MDPPPLRLDRTAARPLAVQLADELRASTTGGTLRAGDRLPSTRALAAQLGVSRTVTAAAYDQLLAEGWIGARRGSGTYVLDTPARDVSNATFRTGAVPDVAMLTPGGPVGLVDLRAGAPCVEALDPRAWRRAWRAAADAPPDAAGDAVGLPAFRAAVVEHLLRHRGLPADPGAVLATAGSTAAVAELARVLPPGAVVAMEEPGYPRAVSALRAAGLAVVPVPVDGRGLVVEAVPAGVAAVYTTPAHQYPLGARLSAARRVALVERARREGFLVVEDDYDGELRYDVAPLPLLAALGPDVVVHLGTASKLLTPTLGCGWAVAPPAVRAAVAEHRAATGARPALAGQRVLAALAAHGDLSRHLRRLRRELGARRAAVVAAVRAAGHEPSGDAAGAHVVVAVADEAGVVAAAADRGIALDGLARHHLAGPGRPGIVLGYAGPARADLDRVLPLLGEVLAASGARDARPLRSGG